GGGTLEARAVEKGLQAIRNRRAMRFDFDLSAEDAAAMGMVCGGEVTVLITPIPAGAASLGLFAGLSALLGRGIESILLTRLSLEEDGSLKRAASGLWNVKTGATEGMDSIQVDALEMHDALQSRRPRLLEFTDHVLVLEPFFPEERLIVFGAGHVGTALARLASQVGFQIQVCDDRKDFLTSGRFPKGAVAQHVQSFKDCLKNLDVSRETSVVILTRGHLHDQEVLEQVLKTPAAYIGMIGSRRKRDAIYKNLLDRGITRADLDRVHCPVGLSIGAQTPEEIGVSIVAELIAERAGRRKGERIG
ncbi:MAG: XdhC family protein, partial [Desulfovibrionales bacterium]